VKTTPGLTNVSLFCFTRIFYIRGMKNIHVPAWKKAPFLRLLLPFCIGILLQWYLPVHLAVPLSIILSCLAALGLFQHLPTPLQFRYQFLRGIVLFVLFCAAGNAIAFWRNITHQAQWVGNLPAPAQAVIVTLQEDPIEKPRSYKALARISHVLSDSNRVTPCAGTIILYLDKQAADSLVYGTPLLLRKWPERIRNSGNPGSFDYAQYCLFNNITHQSYLTRADFAVLPTPPENPAARFTRWLLQLRNAVLALLENYIPGEKESGVAQALLIGYRDHLDKDLVKSYSDTGVIHVIAISGLHLGMIYALLLFLLQPLQKVKKLRWLKPLLILSLLWLFSLLAGASPSVLRAAVMFTVIVAGSALQQKPNTINSLAASAFLLLCYNPFYLWDAGFQLSYAAVLSIVLFQKHIYHWYRFTNKAMDALWKLNAVTLSAQVLTLPLLLYHFHQFPNLFLVTNIVAIPLSGLILFGELLLCCTAFVPVLAHGLGKLVGYGIQWMNRTIENTSSFSFAVTRDITISTLQAICLYGCIIGLSAWLLRRSKPWFFMALGSLVLFTAAGTWENYQHVSHPRLVIYKTPKHSALDFMSANHHYFVGDTLLQYKSSSSGAALHESRRIFNTRATKSLHNLQQAGGLFFFQNKRVFLLQPGIKETPARVDLLIVSQNPKGSAAAWLQAIATPQVVLDAGNNFTTRKQWKQACTQAGILFYDVNENGAYIWEPR
jgi:competence protein ComEC